MPKETKRPQMRISFSTAQNADRSNVVPIFWHYYDRDAAARHQRPPRDSQPQPAQAQPAQEPTIAELIEEMRKKVQE